MAINPIIEKFASCNLITALNMVHCGFELETQAVCGRKSNNMSHAPTKTINTEKLDKHANEKADDIFLDVGATRTLASMDVSAYVALVRYYQAKNKIDITPKKLELYKWVKENCITFSHLKNAISEEVWNKLREKSIDAVKKKVKVEKFCEYKQVNGMSGFLPEVLTKWNDELLTCEHDGSVKGPEIQTKGRKKAKEFLQAAKIVFDGTPMEIDEKCSFHIHLSLPEVNHSYGADFQVWMYEYLLTHIDEVPESVKKRWSNEQWRNQYWGLKVDAGKYMFVAYRGEHGTWEFRCFGNVSNYKDAMRCLILAVKALQYAYKCKLKKIKPLCKHAYDFSQSMFNKAIKSSNPKETMINEIARNEGGAYQIGSNDDDVEDDEAA